MSALNRTAVRLSTARDTKTLARRAGATRGRCVCRAQSTSNACRVRSKIERWSVECPRTVSGAFVGCIGHPMRLSSALGSILAHAKRRSSGRVCRVLRTWRRLLCRVLTPRFQYALGPTMQRASFLCILGRSLCFDIQKVLLQLDVVHTWNPISTLARQIRINWEAYAGRSRFGDCRLTLNL